jgi:Flp pilus assembly protein TadD
MRRDSYGLAYNLTRRAAEVKPDNAAAWHNMGKCYHERQKDAEADEHFRRAVKMKADFPNAWRVCRCPPSTVRTSVLVSTLLIEL